MPQKKETIATIATAKRKRERKKRAPLTKRSHYRNFKKKRKRERTLKIVYKYRERGM